MRLPAKKKKKSVGCRHTVNLSVAFHIGLHGGADVIRTDSYVITQTKISRIAGLPYFLTHGGPLLKMHLKQKFKVLRKNNRRPLINNDEDQ